MVLIMTLANGGKISFALPSDMPRSMHETLGVMLPAGTRGTRGAASLQ